MKEILGNVYEGVACIAWSRVLRDKNRERDKARDNGQVHISFMSRLSEKQGKS
jgi:hypothetical protein